jgi:hypothetical protein
MADGSLMLFAPGVLTASLPAVVLSAISTLREPLSRKGKAFEMAMLRFFRGTGTGLRAESFKVRRHGVEYQYDVVVIWGDYIFIFECKNHSLSGRHPVQAYYFEVQAESDSRQVKRLANALTNHSDILPEALDIDAADKKIVPCVLNALPYSRPGEQNGVYFTDASSVKRFFGSRYFHLKTSYPVDDNTRILHRTAMQQLWEGDVPTPKDFMRHLEDPFQMKLMLAHTDITTRPFPIADDHLVAAQEFIRTEITIESYAAFAGLSADAIRQESAEVARHVEELKARLNERRQGGS